MLVQRLPQPRVEMTPAIIIEDIGSNHHAPADGWVLGERDERVEAVEVWNDDGMEGDRLCQQAETPARQTKLFRISAGQAAKDRHQELGGKRQEARYLPFCSDSHIQARLGLEKGTSQGRVCTEWRAHYYACKASDFISRALQST
jgi:hypothetical protein